MSKPNVWVLNKSGHDFSAAEEFGALRYITEGLLDRYSLNHTYRIIADALHDSTPDDYIIVTGMVHMGYVLSATFAAKHGRLNLLIFDRKTLRYVPRELNVSSLV